MREISPWLRLATTLQPALRATLGTRGGTGTGFFMVTTVEERGIHPHAGRVRSRRVASNQDRSSQGRL
jgi:hypothetical protein